MAASRAGNEAPSRPSYKPKAQKVEAPPLEGGASSLREALQKAVVERPEVKRTHAPDLKETLRNLAPKATVSSPKKEIPPAAPIKKPAELPESLLREMLEVDKGDDEK